MSQDAPICTDFELRWSHGDLASLTSIFCQQTDRKPASGSERQTLPTKHTQKTVDTSKKNKKKTQLTEDERQAYFAQYMEDHTESLGAFFGCAPTDFMEN